MSELKFKVGDLVTKSAKKHPSIQDGVFEVIESFYDRGCVSGQAVVINGYAYRIDIGWVEIAKNQIVSNILNDL